MNHRFARLLFVAALLLTVANWFYVRRTRAAQQSVSSQPTCRLFVPSEWGDFKYSSDHYGLVFQDNDSTLRFITNVPCEGTPPVALEIHRGNGPN